MTALEVLKKARERLSNPDHWAKGKWSDYGIEPAYCALGTIEVVEYECLKGNVASPSPAAQALLETINSVVKRKWRSIPHWNDVRTRTHSQILKAFDLAIAKLEGQPVKPRRARQVKKQAPEKGLSGTPKLSKEAQMVIAHQLSKSKEVAHSK